MMKGLRHAVMFFNTVRHIQNQGILTLYPEKELFQT